MNDLGTLDFDVTQLSDVQKAALKTLIERKKAQLFRRRSTSRPADKTRPGEQ